MVTHTKIYTPPTLEKVPEVSPRQSVFFNRLLDIFHFDILHQRGGYLFVKTRYLNPIVSLYGWTMKVC